MPAPRPRSAGNRGTGPGSRASPACTPADSNGRKVWRVKSRSDASGPPRRRWHRGTVVLPAAGEGARESVRTQVPDAVSSDSVVLPRFVFSAAVAAGADAGTLAREARLPGWLFTVSESRVSSQYAMRLWKLAEWMLRDPLVAFTVGQRHQRGDLSLYDYLFSTSPTLRDGLAVQGEFLHLVTG